MPDLERAGCILFWGYNPSLARIVHATAAVAALNRGAKLVVVDPRRVGLARRATQWLRVRPGTDTALALSIAHVMIARGWFDRDFIRDWTNGPLLVRDDNGRLLRAADIDPSGEAGKYVAWDAASGRPVAFDPETRRLRCPPRTSRLPAISTSPRPSGSISCRPVFARLAELCRRLRAEGGRGDHRRRRRRDRGHRPASVGVEAGRLLRLERRRAAHQLHPDGARHRPALHPHRQPRRAGRQRAFRRGAREPDRRCRAAFEGAARQGARPSGPPARAVTLGIRHLRRGL